MNRRTLIQDSLDYIEDNLAAEIYASDLAEKAGLSLFYYYRLFQSATGMPIMQYILRRRLLHAIYQIRCGSSKIDAALHYGFDTYAGFYKAFLREFGCTPSAFLKSHRAKQPYRLNLTKEEHMVVTRKKAAEVLTHWKLDDAAVSDIYYEGTGNKNDNAYYIGDAYVLKFTANLGKLENHTELSKSIHSIGLCAATPLITAAGKEYVQDGELYFYLTKRLPGSQMQAADFYEGDCKSKARFVGEILGQLHLVLAKMELPINDANLYETLKGWALPKAKDALGWSDDACSAYLAAFGELYDTLPRQIIHRDPNPGNIICADDQWGFIDFELSERNVRIYDPCYAATALLSETFAGGDPSTLEKWPEIYRNIIRGYDSVVNLTAEERKALPYMILANQLVCVAWFAEQAKYSDLFETNKRMTVWLEDNFHNLCIDA